MSLGATSNYLQNNFNSHNPCLAPIYEFENFRLDSAHLMLYKNETVVSLTPKQTETLVALVEKRGEVVSKDELMTRLWGDTAVEESNLSQNLYVLRKTLGNCADGRPFIETFRRRGYRFNGELKQAGEIELLVATRTKTLTVTESETDESKISPISRRKYFLAIGAGMLGLLVLVFGAFRYYQSDSKNGQPRNSAVPLIKMTRLTPDQNIGDMTISPDGKYLAYGLTEKGKNSLWLKDIASGSTTQIMPPAADSYGDLVFSPDGTQIFYTVKIKNSPNLTIFRIPTFDRGDAQEIVHNVISPSTVSPDGKQIAFLREENREKRLMIANTDGSGERILSSADGKTFWYESWGSNLSWSPDGQKIAICGGEMIERRGHYKLFEISVSDGTRRNIPIPDWDYADDVAWLSDQTGLLVVARETETSPWQIWRVSYPNGETRHITNDTNNYDDLSLSADSHVLVIRQNLSNVNLWTMPFDEPNQAKQLTFGATVSASDGYYGIAFMPDGKIIYTSPRSGNFDLWMMNADGSGQKQLTKNAGEFNGRPRVTPDGRTIVFVSSRTGTGQIWRMDGDGGNSLQLTDAKAADHPWLSPDGDWVYFTLWQEERQIIAKIPIGGGEIVPVYEKNNPHWASVSPDGRQMFFGFYEEGSPQPWKTGLLSLENVEILKVFQVSGAWQGWTADSKSVIFVRGNPSNFWAVPIDGGKPHQLTNFDNGQTSMFAISPDFKQIAFARGKPTAEAVLISDF